MRRRMSGRSQAVLYCRISKNPSHDEAGVRRQQHDCMAMAEREGIDVVSTFLDDDRSAYRGRRRPGWDKVVSTIKDGAVDTLLVWHVDRLTRHPRELEDLVELLEVTGVRVCTVAAGEVDLATASGRLVARMLGSVARHESEHAGERLKLKHAELARSGKRNGGCRPFGFLNDGVTIRDDEADAIRHAARRLLEGDSLADVCRAMPLLSSTGRPWTRKAMRTMLRSGRVAGLREHHGEVVANAVWPGILDRSTWEAVRASLGDPRRKIMKPATKYLLTGLAVDTYGRKLIARPNQSGARSYVTEQPAPGKPGVRVEADPLEALVVETVLRVTDTTSFASSEATENLDVSKITNLEAELAELAELRGSGTISMAEWLVVREGLQARLDAAREALGVPERPKVTTVGLDKPGALREAWDGLSIADRRDVIAALVEAVVVGPAVKGRNTFDADRITVRWRG
jgi:DNA invertase Pin-like site-specific DNA recombinase